MSIGQKTFIELNRRFRRLEQAASPERNAAASYRSLFEGDSTLDWEDILRRNRVVILGEAGSGKTEEFQNRTRLLADANEAAFFVRLDRLAAEPLHAILSTDQLKRFEQWKRGSELGTFFLDAVDEAKFHRLSDFYTALDRLKAALGRYELARARIILSSRISEWQPANDEYKFNGRFPAPKIERENESEDNSRETPDQALLVVQLEPLDKEQVKLFAISQGVSSVSQFIEALDQNHAWEFARRPLDVLELLFFWNENGRLGSLTEIIELDVQSKLMPRAEKDEHPLSYEEARTGAEWLAAASLFSRKFVFKVPEDIPSGAALDPRRCVPTLWNLQQCRTLLGRALFDSATYGRIRFHHRAVAEYLAAKWLTERIEEGCPIYELEQILTTITKGERIIRPSLSAIAAWLCCGSEPWNKAVRDWVIRAEPGIHLVYGDPARLPVDYRRQVLRALSQRSRDRKYERLDATTEALSRLAHLDLSGDIARLVSDASLTDAMRIQLLQIIFYGRLRGCLTAVLDIIADASTSEFLKRYGAFTVREIGNENELKRLAEIADSMSEIPERLCSIIATALDRKSVV